ncbi:MAG: AbrB/MazE/SpoVT family DNA-binding domain-containing protein [Candidatus Nitrosotenuis sp.]
MTPTIITVTKKGQATLPKSLREKHKIGKKAFAVDTEEGILFKPVTDPMMEKGSLKTLFKDKTSRQLIREARSEEAKKENRLSRLAKL